MKKSTGFCSTFFFALSNKLRVKILQELVLASFSVNDLAKKLSCERTLVSHNLKLLNKAELVKFKKKGKHRLYFANMSIVPAVFEFMNKIVCSGCSLRQTCKLLNEKQKIKISKSTRTSCSSCS